MNYKVFKTDKNDGFYFPLYNLKGLKSSITPNMLGDIKIDYHHFLLPPISELGLYESTGRHVIIYIDDIPYYLSGQSLNQQNDILEVSYNALHQIVRRTNPLYEINTTSFIPLNHNIELHEVTYTNKSYNPQNIKIVTAPLLYGRSADNIHDHRHVTSLLNRIEVIDKGILLTPTLSFDERGHNPNDITYGFISNSADLDIECYYPTYDEFVDGGSMHYPKGLKNGKSPGYKVNGYEALGGISYKNVVVKSGESITFYMGFAIEKKNEILSFLNLLNKEWFHKQLNDSIPYFKGITDSLKMTLRDDETSNFLSFIPHQPVFRRLFGNSYLPHHDYGKGGRGWRDLFQDLLFMIMTFDDKVRDHLLNNFQGVRIDGSNATIIGDKPGEFKADRNNITRIWSDHALWPVLTLDSYMNYFNDFDILLEEVTYFSDQFTHYTKKTHRIPHDDYLLRNSSGVYKGTILEHVLLETVVGSLNTGSHGFIKIMDADWNDGLDMASDKGETIAFTHFYIKNLFKMVEYLNRFDDVYLFESLGKLILTMNEKGSLDIFFDQVEDFNDQKVKYASKDLIKEIEYYAFNLQNKIQHAFMENGALQSYIDNDGNPLDDNTVSLTGQAMALLSETLLEEDALKVANVTRKHLFDKSLGGYKLNEDYKEVKLNMGRAYGFAYGHKENGALFSHMALMYIYGLYNYNLVEFAHEGLYALIDRAIYKDSKTALGIPEYFNDLGEGKYLYLTGSATWLLKTLKESVFGLKMEEGKLFIEPKLRNIDFMNGKAVINTILYGKESTITFINKKHLDYRLYKISSVVANGVTIDLPIQKHYQKIEVYLDENYVI